MSASRLCQVLCTLQNVTGWMLMLTCRRHFSFPANYITRHGVYCNPLPRSDRTTFLPIISYHHILDIPGGQISAVRMFSELFIPNPDLIMSLETRIGSIYSAYIFRIS